MLGVEDEWKAVLPLAGIRDEAARIDGACTGMACAVNAAVGSLNAAWMF